MKAALAVMKLPYSDALHVLAYPRERTKTPQVWHLVAFASFGAVPTRTSYDNRMIAASKIIDPNERASTRECLRLESHFVFDDHFCRVGRGNDKGHIESLVSYGRRNLLVPVSAFPIFAELKAHLEAACRADLSRRVCTTPN